MSIKTFSKWTYNEDIELQNLIILCLIKGNIRNIKSNIEFIRLYRHKTLFSSDDDYFLNLCELAIKFIENKIINHNDSFKKNKKNSFNSIINTNELNELNISKVEIDKHGPFLEDIPNIFLIKFSEINNYYSDKSVNKMDYKEIEDLVKDFYSLVLLAEDYKINNNIEKTLLECFENEDDDNRENINENENEYEINENDYEKDND